MKLLFTGRKLLFSCSFFVITLGSAPIVQGDEIPVEILFQRAKYGEIQLSPNGSNVAVVTKVNGRNNLAIIDLDKRDAKVVTSFNANDVLRVQWINNERLLLAAGDAQEATGLARFSGWYAVNRDGSEGRQLTRGQMEFLGLPAGAGSDVFHRQRWTNSL